jgi:isocitrate/isopropylmalate dehydrogenase
MRFAYSTPQARPRKILIIATKNTSMKDGMVLWEEIALKVSENFPNVEWDNMLVNAMKVRMVTNSTSLDTVVGTNLHMDIISDMAATLAGSLAIASSRNLDSTRNNPSMFEPVHQSGFHVMERGP